MRLPRSFEPSRVDYYEGFLVVTPFLTGTGLVLDERFHGAAVRLATMFGQPVWPEGLALVCAEARRRFSSPSVQYAVIDFFNKRGAF